MSTFKSISLLPEHPGPINGNETLIISNIDDINNELISLKYNLSSLKDEVADHVSATVSADLEEFKDQTSADISTFIDTHIHPLRRIIGLSTLDYYTYIGDDINEISNNIADYPELSSISNDVIWFDTTGDERFLNDAFSRIDKLQAQVYKLGLQYRDMHNILLYGIIPGNAYNNTKDEMVKIAEVLSPPSHITSDINNNNLLEIHIYGNYICKNKQLYYMMFNPSGFIPNDINFKWIFNNHDRGIENQKTISTSIDNKNYVLRAQLINKDLSGYSALMSLSAAIYDNTNTAFLFSSNQNTINTVINKLSNDTEKNIIYFYISSDYYDSAFSDYIYSDDFGVCLDVGSTDKISSNILIFGNDYIELNNSDLYYCVLDDTHSQFPINTNIRWYFLSSYYDELSNLVTAKSSIYKLTILSSDGFTPYGELTYMICPPITHTPVCLVSTFISSFTDRQVSEYEVKDISAELFAESINDNALSACKSIKGIGGRLPNSYLAEPTVKANCAKYDTTNNIAEKQSTLYPGELIFLSDKNKLAVYNGENLVLVGSDSSSGGSGLTKLEIQDVGLDYLTFISDPNDKDNGYKKLAFTADGKFNIIQKYNNYPQYTFDKHNKGLVWVSRLLQIGKIYAGGESISYNNVINPTIRYNPKSLVSHNFIELVNASYEDIILDNIYILYHSPDTEKNNQDAYKFKPFNTSHAWEFLKLLGKIKAGGTYLIRGAQCNPCNNNMFNIDECDIEWRMRTTDDKDILNSTLGEFTRTGDLIQFSLKAVSFFLFYCTDDNIDLLKDIITNTKKPNDAIDDTDTSKGGYIDLLGIGTTGDDGESPTFVSDSAAAAKGYSATTTLNNNIFVKWFYMEPAQQGNTARASRKESKLLTHIDLEKQPVIYKNGTRNQYYYNDDQKLKYKPNASFTSNNKGFFTNKTNFDKNKPNIINITFGILATEKTDGTKASRCFNWVSIGYYDEYVEIRKCNESNVNDDHYEWKKYYSITSKDNDDFIEGEGYNFHNFYDRIRWSTPDGIYVTTHKVVAKNKFTSGTYEYRIRRDYDDTYMSDIKTFTVYNDSEVESFLFILTSDQLGFNWIEYQAWKSACDAICNNEKQFKFTINTGDIALSGNRVNEWLDYYDGRKSMNNKEEMFTIGNNDLCGNPTHILGDGNDNTSKFNLINIQYYYTFELDCNNPPIAEYEGNKYPIYSLYSFNYGAFHFISLVSEIRSHYGYAFDTVSATNNLEFANNMNANVERWFINDLRLYKTSTGYNDCSRCIVFMHEMPFTIVTRDFFDIHTLKTNGRTTEITGCKLNLENANGDYRFSRIFKKEGIRLIIGGHKHTFSLSNPLYDAPEECIIPNDMDYDNDPFISSEVNYVLSRKPVIEIPFDGAVFGISSTISSDSSLSDELELLHYVDLLSTYASSEYKDDFYNILTRIINYDNNTKMQFNHINLSSDLSTFLRINYVDKITAPTYVMSLATGYKLLSNKELAAPLTDNLSISRYTPWLLSYAAATKYDINKNSATANNVQTRPTYITYDLSPNAISVCIKLVDNIYYVDGSGNSIAFTLYNLNKQLSCCPLTFGKWGTKSEYSYFNPTTNPLYNKIYSNYMHDDTYIIKL